MSAHGATPADRAFCGSAGRRLVNQARRLAQLHRAPERAVQHPCERQHVSLGVARLFPVPHRLWRSGHGLIGVLCYPANWQLASLPKALSATEVERLLGVLGHDGPSARRAVAIVRCALDLGLRSCEVAKLGLDDIDWRAGTVTLRGTKSRREDILPLPAATGRAIADYLKRERPPTINRAVFVRH